MTYTWIRARHLTIGDTVRTDGGASAVVTAVQPAPAGHRRPAPWRRIYVITPTGALWPDPIEVPHPDWPMAVVALAQRPAPAPLITDQVEMHAAMQGTVRHLAPCQYPMYACAGSAGGCAN